ncbi:MAG: AI-2E family transporter [Candidatus Gracilibacteria bacterium]|nr:AI-2E family transporter [Candidatus Gracilibacteria bacterium]
MKLFIILLFGIGIWIVYKISTILFILIFSLFLTVLFSPFLNYMNKHKINDLFGILIIFFILFIILSILIFSIIPLIVNQSANFFNSISTWVNNLRDTYNQSGIEGFGLPGIIETLLQNLNIEQILNYLRDNTSQLSQIVGTNFQDFLSSGVGVISGFTSFLFAFVTVFIFTFFITLERYHIRKTFYSILPQNLSKYLYDNESEIITRLSEWLKGQLILGCSVFILTLIGLGILKLFGIDLNGIFTLALIAGFMEFIPYIGTFISFAIALIISLGAGWQGFVGVFIVYLIIQQLEGNVLTPFIMGKTLSLTPFTVLFTMLIGGSLFGIIGIIFAIPFLAVVQIFLKPYLNRRKKENTFIM